jgi:hypothetical protein
VGVAIVLAGGLYTLSRQVSQDYVMTSLAVKTLILAVFPVILWRSGLLPESEAAVLRVAADRVGQRLLQVSRTLLAGSQV